MAEIRSEVLHVRVTVAEAREFRLAAKAERVSVSELIRRAVRDRTDSMMTRSESGRAEG